MPSASPPRPTASRARRRAARRAAARGDRHRPPGLSNARLAGDALDRHCRLDAASSRFLQAATTRLGWSARSFHRVIRVARTIADLAASAEITTVHLGEAIQYRRALQSR